MMNKIPEMEAVLGTMNFGPQLDFINSQKLVEEFLKQGYTEIDTAFVYNNGESEEFLGKIFLDIDRKSFKVATKVNPKITGKLDPKSIKNQIETSLKRMKLEYIDVLYLHFPDPTTKLIDTLGAVHDLFEENKVRDFGLSNFPAWQVVDIYHTCSNKGWLKPTIYQGMYNGLSRKVEHELFPALKELGMRFYVYNPLAGGILSGKYKNFEESPANGRFTVRPNYKGRYWKESFFEALNNLRNVCDSNGIQLYEAALRWLYHHSCLDPNRGDKVILGVSKNDQLEMNIKAIKQGNLPNTIVEAFNHSWSMVRSESPEYFRFFNS